MNTNPIHILFIADIVGKPPYELTISWIHSLKERYTIDLIIANGENCASGKGMTDSIAQSLFNMGIDVITSGNHIWGREKFLPHLNENPFILRPLNYPSGCPGHGSCITERQTSHKIGVINLQGRSFMYPINCPFQTADSEIEKMKKENVNVIFVDFHAEATAEKMALGHYLDGRISCLIGSHTHVQTADEKILPNGTAYITDAGMTGPIDSVIGMDKHVAIRRFMTQLPVHYKIAGGKLMFNGVIIEIDNLSGKAISIQRVRLYE